MSTLRQELQDEWEVTPINGFLPKSEPLAVLPEQFQDLDFICSNLATFIPQQQVAEYVENYLQDHSETIKLITDDIPLIISLFRDYCFLTSAYLLESCHAAYLVTREFTQQARQVLPQKLAVPLHYLGEIQDAKPWMDYHRSYALYNFKKRNIDGPVIYHNIDTVRTFTNNPGEPGFILTHTSIAGHSPKVVGHIESIFEYLQSNQRNKINEELNGFASQLSSIKDEMKQMYTRNSIESYFEFRTFMSGTYGTPMFKNGVIYEGIDDKPIRIRGASGALDMMMPTVDRFFGLQELFPDNALTALLAEYKQYIPEQHQLYIKRVENLVQRLQFFDYVRQDSQTLLYFLNCLYNIVLFRQTHFNFVKEYVIKREKVAVGSAGANAASFVSNQLIILYDYFISLCNEKNKCQHQNKKDLQKIESLKANVAEKKEIFVATLEALKRNLSNIYNSIIDKNLSTSSESALSLHKNDNLSYLKEQFYLPLNKIYFEQSKDEILSKKAQQCLDDFLLKEEIKPSLKNQSSMQSLSKCPVSGNQNQTFQDQNKVESMSPCIHAMMAMRSQNMDQKGCPVQPNGAPQQQSNQSSLNLIFKNTIEKLSYMVSCYEQEIGITPTLQISIYQILSAFLKSQLATKEKILIIQNQNSSNLILKHINQWLERYYPEMDPKVVIEVFNVPEYENITQQQVQEIISQEIIEHQYNTALMIMSFTTPFIEKYLNIPEISKMCREYNIYFVLDVISSFSMAPLKLHDWHVDAAFFQPSQHSPIGGLFIHDKHKKNDHYFKNWFDHETKPKKVNKMCASAENLSDQSDDASDYDDNDDQKYTIFDKECRSLKRFEVSRFEKLEIVKLNAYYEYLVEAGVNNLSRKTKDMMEYLTYLYKDIPYLQVDSFSSQYTNIFQFKIKKNSSSFTTKQLHKFLKENNFECEYQNTSDNIRVHLNGLYNHFTECYELFNKTKGLLDGSL